jgi:hypothetical protein
MIRARAEEVVATLGLAATVAVALLAGGARLLKEPRLPGGLAFGAWAGAFALAGFLLGRTALVGPP